MFDCKVKHIPIATGRLLVAILSKKDAQRYGLVEGDRIKIYSGKKKIVALLDTVDNEHLVSNGEIGFMSELSERFNLARGAKVKIAIQPKPDSVRMIKEKLLGKDFTYDMLKTILTDVVENKLTDIELTYFVASSVSKSLTLDELTNLTRAMVDTGKVLSLDKKIVIDKHCVGGVAGNRTSMVVIPILASLGLTIPKTSSRSITSAAGTADTVEVLCDVTASIPKMKSILKKTGGSLVWGGGINFAPADDKIITVAKAIEIDSDSKMIASILAKKHSVGSTHILIDIPVGKHAKVKTLSHAAKIEDQFLAVGKKLGKKIKVITTDGSEPIGNGIGPALEARDVLRLLERHEKRPIDLEEKSVMMAVILAEMAGMKNAKKKIMHALDSGAAYKKMVQIIKAQGPKVWRSEDVALGKYHVDILAKKSGVITAINNQQMNKLAHILDAPSAKGAGVYLHKHVDEEVMKGEPLFTLYADSKERLELGKNFELYFYPIEIKPLKKKVTKKKTPKRTVKTATKKSSTKAVQKKKTVPKKSSKVKKVAPKTRKK